MKPKVFQLEGRDHYIVPVTMIVEGVLPGSNGALLYQEQDLRKSAGLWNGRPVVIYHPTMSNNGAAGAPTVFDTQRVGTVFGVHFDERKHALGGEVWLDKERLGRISPEVASAVLRGNPVEVSTGLYSEIESTTGTWQGVSYAGIARNLHPDHLAILPTGTGACSVSDGCGLAV